MIETDQLLVLLQTTTSVHLVKQLCFAFLWCGVMWSGLLCSSVVWSGMRMVWSTLAWCDVVGCVLVWSDVWSRPVQFGLVLPGLGWSGLV